MADRDLYQTLGISRGASRADIKKSYRKLARELHPDRNPDNKKAEDRFKEVSYAYDVLGDEEKRKLYDEFGEVGLKEGFDPEAFRQYKAWQRAGGGRRPSGGATFNLEDLLRGGGSGGYGAFHPEDLMGGLGGFGRAPRRQRTPDLEAEIGLTFVEALRGVERELTLGLPAQAPPGQASTKTIRARIPPGVRPGGKVRLRGQGQSGPGGPGDLVLTVRVAAHPHFRRDGDDLHVDLPVTLAEAYRGAKVPVPTLNGKVTLTVPAGTQPGAKLRLRGKGAQRGKAEGDLIVHVQPQLPPKDQETVQKALDDLESAYPEDLREGLEL